MICPHPPSCFCIFSIARPGGLTSSRLIRPYPPPYDVASVVDLSLLKGDAGRVGVRYRRLGRSVAGAAQHHDAGRRGHGRGLAAVGPRALASLRRLAARGRSAGIRAAAALPPPPPRGAPPHTGVRAAGAGEAGTCGLVSGQLDADVPGLAAAPTALSAILQSESGVGDWGLADYPRRVLEHFSSPALVYSLLNVTR